MKALEILENLKEYIEIESRVGDLDYSHYSVIIDYVDESIEELEELENRSCSNCNNFKIFNSKVVRDSCSILNVSDIGGCGDYFEPKKG